MKRWIHITLMTMLLFSSISTQARYLQADKLDVLGNANDPEIITTFQNQNSSVLYNSSIGPSVPLVGIPRPESQPYIHIPRVSPTSQLNHLYGYGDQNPVMNIDPYGLMSCAANPAQCAAAGMIDGAGSKAVQQTAKQIASAAAAAAGASTPAEQQKKNECIEQCYHLLEDTSVSSDIRTNNFHKCVNDCMSCDK